MYHADSQGHGLERALDLNRLAGNFDASFKATCAVNHIHPEQNIHQRGLAGAVFPYDSVNFSGHNG